MPFHRRHCEEFPSLCRSACPAANWGSCRSGPFDCLPEHAAREALSYSEFLEHRYGIVQPADGADDTDELPAAVSGRLGEDFPDDIGDADLGTDGPRRTLN